MVVSGPCNLVQSVPFACMVFDDQSVHCITWQFVETVFHEAYGSPPIQVAIHLREGRGINSTHFPKYSIHTVTHELPAEVVPKKPAKSTP